MNVQTQPAIAAGPQSGRGDDSAGLAAETVSEVIWILDLNRLRFPYINPAIGKLRGFSAAETMAQRLDQVLAAESLNRLQRVFPRRLEEFRQGKRDAFVEEFEVLTQGGGSIRTESTITLRVNPKTSHLEAYGVTRDAVRRERLEAQPVPARKVEAAEPAADRVAHDFNNILAAMIMHLEVLPLDPKLPEAIRKTIQDLTSQARLASKLAGQLLRFSRRSVPSLRPQDRPAEEAKSASIPELPRGGQETLLLVEDEPAVRNTLNLYLSRYGYRVLQAVSGVQALEVWARHGQDIQMLLTDMVMPEDLNGLELAERLRAIRPNLPVIIFSGYSSELVQESGSRLRNIAYMAKPCAPAELADMVRRCLDEAAPGRAG